MRVTKSRALGRTLSIDFTVAVIVSLAAIFCVSSAAHAQRGAITLPRNLADLSSNAGQIIQGRVVSATVEPDPRYNHLQTLVLTLAVDDVLKGQAPTTFTFREFLWDVRDISDHAGYHLGDEVLLFLNGPTPLGFITPVGLQQGRFRVVKGADGQDYAINANQNSGLFDNVVRSGALNAGKLSAKSRATVQSFQRGPIPLTALKESVHLLVQSPGAVR
ncbi:hypothetical protein [Granulicella sp. L46]|jgi:hypothetical protein|uniref:hypothetical protein n=1 Tax=Granulicella sp. L46 TaxID=1641865 RepID=UPI00131D7439|nr:hypothetical protein [Granulicella sp. L46]